MTTSFSKTLLFFLLLFISVYTYAANKVITIVNHTDMPISFHSTGKYHINSSELFTDGEIEPGATKAYKTNVQDDISGSPRINLEFKTNNEIVLKTIITFYRDNVDTEQINPHYFISTKYNKSGMVLDILTDFKSN